VPLAPASNLPANSALPSLSVGGGPEAGRVLESPGGRGLRAELDYREQPVSREPRECFLVAPGYPPVAPHFLGELPLVFLEIEDFPARPDYLAEPGLLA